MGCRRSSTRKESARWRRHCSKSTISGLSSSARAARCMPSTGSDFSLQAGRKPGHRRRERLGQVGHGARDARPDRAQRPGGARPGAAGRRGPAQDEPRRAAQDPRAGDRGDLPGPDDQPQPDHAHRAADHREHAHARDVLAGRSQGAGDRAARPGGYSTARAAHQRLSVPVLRRHAPARDDRHRAGAEPEAAGRRRADHRAGCDGAGAGAQAAGRAAPRDGHGHGDHHA